MVWVEIFFVLENEEGSDSFAEAAANAAREIRGDIRNLQSELAPDRAVV